MIAAPMTEVPTPTSKRLRSTTVKVLWLRGSASASWLFSAVPACASVLGSGGRACAGGKVSGGDSSVIGACPRARFYRCQTPNCLVIAEELVQPNIRRIAPQWEKQDTGWNIVRRRLGSGLKSKAFQGCRHGDRTALPFRLETPSTRRQTTTFRSVAE